MVTSRGITESIGVRIATLASVCVLLLVLACTGSAAAEPVLNAELTNNGSEVQTILVNATGGKFTLSFGSGGPGISETTEIPATATANEVQGALDALTNVSVGGGSVTVTGGPGDAGDTHPYLVTFDGGPLRYKNVGQLVGSSAPGAPLTGGVSSLMGVGSSVRVETSPAVSLDPELHISLPFIQDGGVSRGERLDYMVAVKNTGSSATVGPVTVEVELPGGEETYVVGVYKPETPDIAVNEPAGGWACTTQRPSGGMPARAVCTRSDVLSAGATYPALRVETWIGSDTPEPVVAHVVVSGGGAAAVGEAVNEFGLTERDFGMADFEASVLGSLGQSYTQAGAHPFTANTHFSFNLSKTLGINIAHGYYLPLQNDRTIVVDTPRGFVGNALSVPKLCTTIANLAECPADSVVGATNITTPGSGSDGNPIVAVKPEHGLPAEFAFKVQLTNTAYTFFPRLRAGDGYGISFESSPNPVVDLEYVGVTLCDFGAKTKTINEFGTIRLEFNGCREAGEIGANEHPLITNPTRCAGAAPVATVRADSYQHPGARLPDGSPNLSDPNWKSLEYANPRLTGCEAVPFEPSAKLVPGNTQADSPTGLSVELKMPTEGLESDTGISQAALDTAKVTFPKGMSINPAAADGLGACSEAQVKLGSNLEAECPESSKVGTIEIVTPLIHEPLRGGVYVASQNQNPFKATLGLYMVFHSAEDGITIKIAGKLVTDPVTGQLTAVFTESPEDPFSKLVLHFTEGPRAPLVNPPTCGTYAIHSEFSPWSAADPANPTPAETVSEDSSFEVNEGPGSSPCPAEGLEPKLKAGLESPNAGVTTPFVMDLSRADGTQRFTALNLTLPKGLFAYLKGVPYCPDAVLASIPSAEGTGRAQLANPSCPSASQVGTVEVGAGSGPYPFHSRGMAYFAGPYKGAPFSIAIVMPAVAGPFDLGNVVVRSGLYVDPHTAQVTVKSDPIPTILDGILLDVRDIRVNVDKPHYIVAPTNCEVMSVGAEVGGGQGVSATASSRFQVGGCAGLKFKPVFKASTSAKTSRNNGASLTVRLSQASGEANIHRVKVELPKALPSRLTTLQKACTEQQFSADPAGCPAASKVGMAVAHTPILPVPLEGPAYFVSHGGAKFPELILVLQGDGVTINLAGETFISKTGVTSSTFAAVPDAPVESFELNLPTGPYSALAANGDLCSKKLVMPTEFTGQNGALTRQNTKISVSGCAKTKQLTRAQKLAIALKACKKKSKTKRAACVKKAREKYGPASGKKGKAKK